MESAAGRLHLTYAIHKNREQSRFFLCPAHSGVFFSHCNGLLSEMRIYITLFIFFTFFNPNISSLTKNWLIF